MLTVAVEPIPSGTISGPLINATILGGIAYPTILSNNMTVYQLPMVEVYGMTNDGVAFFVKESGIGAPTRQITRVVSVYKTSVT
jgi:hypothetical protein